MTPDAPSPAPAELTAENVEDVLAAAGHHPLEFGLFSKAGEFDESFVSDKLDPLIAGHADFPFDEVCRQLDDEPEPAFHDTSMTRANVAKLLRELFLWIVASKVEDQRALKLAGTRAVAAAWVLNGKIFDDKPAHMVAKSYGLHHDKFSKKAAEFSRQFKIQNRFQLNDAKNPKRAIL